MSGHILIRGNAKRIPLADKSVHCVVTSPPYWGLRSYSACSCSDQGRLEIAQDERGDRHTAGGAIAFHRIGKPDPNCKECGGTGTNKFIDQHQLGLEPTPEEFVAGMVAVFREVKRILRDDGTVWLNLGSSYASGDSAAIQSRRASRAPACDSDGKEPGDSQGPDSSCPDLDGGPQDGSQNHRVRKARTGRQPCKSSPLLATKDQNTAMMASGDAGASPLADPQSTKPSLSSSALDACGPEDLVLGLPQDDHSLLIDAPQSVDKSACTLGISRTSGTSDSGTQDTESSGLASRLTPKDDGGITWAYSTIPLLKLKPKDLVMMPHLLALALQADGWYVRMDCVWSKPNPMPESVRDRPTKSHEYLFLLSKQERYYFDADAVREETNGIRYEWQNEPYKCGDTTIHHKASNPRSIADPNAGRNIRSVWTIPNESYEGAHFATFPRKLIEPCIKAGTSEKGCCSECGAGWERMTDEKYIGSTNRNGSAGNRAKGPMERLRADGSSCSQFEKTRMGWKDSSTTGWRPSCSCNASIKPCTVFDPFIGSGTSIVVANALGRHGIGLDLSAEYLGLAQRRITRPHADAIRHRPNETYPLWEQS